MPLQWNEVKKGLKMSDFHIFNTMGRLSSEGDIFKPVLGKGIYLKAVTEKHCKNDGQKKDNKRMGNKSKRFSFV